MSDKSIIEIFSELLNLVTDEVLSTEGNKPICAYFKPGGIEVFVKYAEYNIRLSPAVLSQFKATIMIEDKLEEINSILKSLGNDYSCELVPHRSLYEKEEWVEEIEGDVINEYVTVVDDSIDREALPKNTFCIIRDCGTPLYLQEPGNHGNLFSLTELRDELGNVQNILENYSEVRLMRDINKKANKVTSAVFDIRDILAIMLPFYDAPSIHAGDAPIIPKKEAMFLEDAQFPERKKPMDGVHDIFEYIMQENYRRKKEGTDAYSSALQQVTEKLNESFSDIASEIEKSRPILGDEITAKDIEMQKEWAQGILKDCMEKYGKWQPVYTMSQYENYNIDTDHGTFLKQVKAKPLEEVSEPTVSSSKSLESKKGSTPSSGRG